MTEGEWICHLMDGPYRARGPFNERAARVQVRYEDGKFATVFPRQMVVRVSRVVQINVQKNLMPDTLELACCSLSGEQLTSVTLQKDGIEEGIPALIRQLRMTFSETHSTADNLRFVLPSRKLL